MNKFKVSDKAGVKGILIVTLIGTIQINLARICRCNLIPAALKNQIQVDGSL